jgi:hypothetical protein
MSRESRRANGRYACETNGQKSVLLMTLFSRIQRKGMAPMDKAHVEELTSQHAALSAQIDEEEHRPLPDMIKLHELKKEKLRLKDELAGHFH